MSVLLELRHYMGHFGPEPGKEIEITTNKSTTMCLKNREFQPECVYKLGVYKKK